MRKGTIDFRKLAFSTAGADIQLEGTYGLRSEALDFHGRARLQAKPSQMITGFKSTLLKPFDRFFHKNGATELPIKVTGERSHPSFGLDFHHKKDEESKQKRNDQQREDRAKAEKQKQKSKDENR